MKKFKLLAVGAAIGVVNGLLGAGGGMIAVPMLTSLGLGEKERHATSVAVILPLTTLSAIMYYFKGSLPLAEAWVYMPFGVVGAVIGAFILPKVSGIALHRIFGVLVAFFAVRMFF